MVSKKVTIVNAEGMHMRPAGMIAKAVKAHSDSEVILKANDKDIKAKNVMQIMAAGLKKGTEVEIVVDGGNLMNSLQCSRTVSANNSKRKWDGITAVPYL